MKLRWLKNYPLCKEKTFPMHRLRRLEKELESFQSKICRNKMVFGVFDSTSLEPFSQTMLIHFRVIRI